MAFQPYDISATEQKWQKTWSEAGESGDLQPPGEDGASRLVLQWPPAAEGLTWTDLRSLVLADVYSRFQRSRGLDARIGRVLDGFQEESLEQALEQEKLPADLVGDKLLDLEFFEKALAIQPAPGVPPGDGVAGQISNTSDPAYYRFTQWIFLELLHSQYISRDPGQVAVRGEVTDSETEEETENEETTEPGCPRWFLELGSFAEKLFADVDKTKWPASLRKEQKAIIGRRRGMDLEIAFIKPFHYEARHIPIFTTRLEAMHGVTFVLLAPGHELIEYVTDPEYSEDVEAYLARYGNGQEASISGVRTGGFALNPITLKKVPVLVSPLALNSYSDGVVFGIPAHDKKQFELARRLKLRIREVIHSNTAKFDMEGALAEAYEGDGKLTNSGSCSGMKPTRARDQMVEILSRRGICNKVTRYSLKDLPVSGESTWGAPVPLYHSAEPGDGTGDKGDGVFPAADGELPLNCPELDLETLKKGNPGLSSCKTAQGEDYAQEDLQREGVMVHRDAGTLLPWLGRAWSFLHLVLPNLSGELEGFREDYEKPFVPQEVVEPEEDPVDSSSVPVASREASVPTREPDEPAPADEGADGNTTDDDLPAAGEEEGDPASTEPELADENNSSDGDEIDSSGESGAGEVEPETAEAVGDVSETAEGGGEASEEEEPEIEKAMRQRLYPFSGGKVDKFLPVDVVFSGNRLSPKEIVGIRCITKFLYKQRHIPFFEPFRRFCAVGCLEFDPGGDSQTGGEKFPGDSSGDLLGRFGSDALRLQMLCLGPADSQATFDVDSLYHIRRFLEKIWRAIGSRIGKGKFVSRNVLVAKHRLIYDVSRRLKDLKFHTAVSSLREFVNFIADPDTTVEEVDKDALETFLVVLKPFAPHLAAELWGRLGNEVSLEDADWPEYSEELVEPAEREHAVFVDGRLIDRMTESIELEEKKLESRALELNSVRDHIGRRKVSRVEVVKGRVIWICLRKKKPVKPRAAVQDNADDGAEGDQQSSAEPPLDSAPSNPEPGESSEKPDSA
ncbi:MAG: class I tRNA ligase family protein [Planctomycetota bacterium]